MRIKKGLVTSLTVVMLTLAVTPAFADNVDTLRERQRNIQSDMNSAIQQRDSARSEANTVNQQILQTSEKVRQAEEELHRVTAELDELNEEIQLNLENLEAAERNLAEKTEEFSQRLRKMYKNGNLGYIEVLLSAEDISDLLSRNHMLQQIASYDKELIAFIREHRDFIEAKKIELEEQKEKVEEVKAEIESRKSQLEAAQREKEALLARLQMDVATFESRYNQLASSSREIDGRIASLQSPSRSNTSRENANTSTNTNSNTSTSNNNSSNETASKPAPTPAPAPATNGSLGSRIAATASKFRGYRYVYGGTTPSGFDCSGFTSYVYRQHGISIPRTSGGQASAGKSVGKANMQPGDIIAFRGHVGIYIGNGNMIHASNPTRGVVIDSVTSGYWANRILSVRRPY